jgi:hypothetical protein
MWTFEIVTFDGALILHHRSHRRVPTPELGAGTTLAWVDPFSMSRDIAMEPAVGIEPTT